MIPLFSRYQAWMIAFAVIALGLAGLVAWGHHDGVMDERKRMAPIVAGYQARIDALVAKIGVLEGALKTQNQAVEDMKTAAKKRELAAEARVKAAKLTADRYRLKASQIAAAKPTGDQCIAARDLIVTTLAGERQ